MISKSLILYNNIEADGLKMWRKNGGSARTRFAKQN